jgi:hypothetical protein
MAATDVVLRKQVYYLVATEPLQKEEVHYEGMTFRFAPLKSPCRHKTKKQQYLYRLKTTYAKEWVALVVRHMFAEKPDIRYRLTHLVAGYAMDK